MKKLLAVAAVMLLALGLPLSAAWAQYAPQNFVDVSSPTLLRGQPQTATACCFIGTVQWVAQSAPRTVGTSFADVNGVASITFTIPADFENGTHSITASGTGLNGSPLSVSTTFTVTGGRQLIPTGSKTLPWVLVGVGSVVVGGGFVGIARRRGKTAA
ncbi:MAG: hypothetical protein ACRDJM_00240 [Actinomycetota bacterium]